MARREGEAVVGAGVDFEEGADAAIAALGGGTGDGDAGSRNSDTSHSDEDVS